MKKLFETWCGISLVKRIVAGLIIGAVLGAGGSAGSPALLILGERFCRSIKSVSLRFWCSFLVISSSVPLLARATAASSVPLLFCICSVPSWHRCHRCICQHAYFPVTLTLAVEAV